MRAHQAAALIALLFAAAAAAALTGSSVPSDYQFLVVRYSGLPRARAPRPPPGLDWTGLQFAPPQ